jgi:hypothetical protein
VRSRRSRRHAARRAESPRGAIDDAWGDDELDELFVGLPAVALEGPKAVGKTAMALRRVEEILSSGFPGIRGLSGRLLRAQLDSYLDRIVDRDFEDLGREVRCPATLRRWMQAYAAATATCGIAVVPAALLGP